MPIAKNSTATFILYLLAFSISVTYTEKLQSSQIQTLLRIQNLLNYPPFLSNWNSSTDFCNAEPTISFTLVCYQETLTQLHITGPIKSPPLPKNFSIDSFITTLTKLPSLKVLKLVSLGLWGQLPSKFTRLTSLEILNLTGNYLQGNIPPSISSLTRLQSLILDNNNFTGTFPRQFGSLSNLAFLSVTNNSLYGYLPRSLASLENLRVLILSINKFSGEVPDMSSLRNLQTLDLRNNEIGPRFPVVSGKIESILLRNNRFGFGIPEEVQSYRHLKELDVSLNRFTGPFPVSLLSLQSLKYLNIAGNRLTGKLFENSPCNGDLHFVNLSSNLLTGKLPSCLRPRDVVYGDNCLETGEENQQPVSLCKREALAVGISPHSEKQTRKKKLILGSSICGGVAVVVGLVFAAFLVVKKFITNRERKKPKIRYISENASTSYTPKMLKDARYITQAMKIGALRVPTYRTFSMEELEVATNNFGSTNFMGESSQGQMYVGKLKDGSCVAIRCLKLKRTYNTQYLMTHIEMISKLRHQHLVSYLGHCFDYFVDDSSSINRVFLVFEYVQNGNLRNWVSETTIKQKLTWSQRIAVTTGVAKGIQFLHAGIVPGLFSNNLGITDVLVDQNLIAKICSYNLPLLADDTFAIRDDHLRNSIAESKEIKNARSEDEGKSDIYDFGLILLEVILGKQINSRNEMEVLRVKLEASIVTDDASRMIISDPVVKNSCSGESVKTMLEICSRCLLEDPAERPSIDDVLWNLQFAAQVQEDVSQSSDEFPVPTLHAS